MLLVIVDADPGLTLIGGTEKGLHAVDHTDEKHRGIVGLGSCLADAHSIAFLDGQQWLGGFAAIGRSEQLLAGGEPEVPLMPRHCLDPRHLEIVVRKP